MKSVKISKALVYYPAVLACAGFVAGCHSTKTHHASTYSSYPTYQATGGPTTAPSESTAGSASSRMTESTQGSVEIPTYEEQVIVGTRTVDSGGVRLRKEIVTETVNQPVQVRRETIVVDREGAPSGQASQGASTNASAGSLGTPFQNGELVIRLHSEEPVVETRVVPSGKIVVQTRTNQEQTTVQRQIRKEKIDVERLGNSDNVVISDNVSKQSNEAVGAPSTDSQKIQGEAPKAAPPSTDLNPPRKTQEIEEPFPRPQPDGRLTFPELYKEKP